MHSLKGLSGSCSSPRCSHQGPSLSASHPNLGQVPSLESASRPGWGQILTWISHLPQPCPPPVIAMRLAEGSRLWKRMLGRQYFNCVCCVLHSEIILKFILPPVLCHGKVHTYKCTHVYIHTHTHIPCILSHYYLSQEMGYSSLCSIVGLLFFHFLCNSLHLLTPNFQSFFLPLPTLAATVCSLRL